MVAFPVDIGGSSLRVPSALPAASSTISTTFFFSRLSLFPLPSCDRIRMVSCQKTWKPQCTTTFPLSSLDSSFRHSCSVTPPAIKPFAGKWFSINGSIEDQLGKMGSIPLALGSGRNGGGSNMPQGWSKVRRGETENTYQNHLIL